MPNGSAEEWEAGWRKSVDTRLSSFDGKLDTLIESMQKLYTRMTVNESAISEIRDSKKAAPRLTQGWLEIALMLLFGIVTATCSASGVILGLINLLRH